MDGWTLDGWPDFWWTGRSSVLSALRFLGPRPGCLNDLLIFWSRKQAREKEKEEERERERAPKHSHCHKLTPIKKTLEFEPGLP